MTNNPTTCVECGKEKCDRPGELIAPHQRNEADQHHYDFFCHGHQPKTCETCDGNKIVTKEGVDPRVYFSCPTCQPKECPACDLFMKNGHVCQPKEEARGGTGGAGHMSGVHNIPVPKEEAKGERCEPSDLKNCTICYDKKCVCQCSVCVTFRLPTPTNPKKEEQELKKALDEAFKNLPAGVFYGHHSDVAWSIAHALAPFFSRLLAEARREQHGLAVAEVERTKHELVLTNGAQVFKACLSALDRVKPESRKE